MILIRNDIMSHVRYVHDTDTYINVADACCDTLHDTHYSIINPNYYKYVSFYYVWNQILSDTIFDTYMIQLTDTNTYLFIMFGTRTYSYESNAFVIRVRVSLTPI